MDTEEDPFDSEDPFASPSEHAGDLAVAPAAATPAARAYPYQPTPAAAAVGEANPSPRADSTFGEEEDPFGSPPPPPIEVDAAAVLEPLQPVAAAIEEVPQEPEAEVPAPSLREVSPMQHHAAALAALRSLTPGRAAATAAQTPISAVLLTPPAAGSFASPSFAADSTAAAAAGGATAAAAHAPLRPASADGYAAMGTGGGGGGSESASHAAAGAVAAFADDEQSLGVAPLLPAPVAMGEAATTASGPYMAPSADNASADNAAVARGFADVAVTSGFQVSYADGPAPAADSLLEAGGGANVQMATAGAGSSPMPFVAADGDESPDGRQQQPLPPDANANGDAFTTVGGDDPFGVPEFDATPPPPVASADVPLDLGTEPSAAVPTEAPSEGASSSSQSYFPTPQLGSDAPSPSYVGDGSTAAVAAPAAAILAPEPPAEVPQQPTAVEPTYGLVAAPAATIDPFAAPLLAGATMMAGDAFGSVTSFTGSRSTVAPPPPPTAVTSADPFAADSTTFFVPATEVPAAGAGAAPAPSHLAQDDPFGGAAAGTVDAFAAPTPSAVSGLPIPVAPAVIEALAPVVLAGVPPPPPPSVASTTAAAVDPFAAGGGAGSLDPFGAPITGANFDGPGAPVDVFAPAQPPPAAFAAAPVTTEGAFAPATTAAVPAGNADAAFYAAAPPTAPGAVTAAPAPPLHPLVPTTAPIGIVAVENTNTFATASPTSPQFPGAMVSSSGASMNTNTGGMGASVGAGLGAGGNGAVDPFSSSHAGDVFGTGDADAFGAPTPPPPPAVAATEDIFAATEPAPSMPPPGIPPLPLRMTPSVARADGSPPTHPQFAATAPAMMKLPTTSGSGAGGDDNVAAANNPFDAAPGDAFGDDPFANASGDDPFCTVTPRMTARGGVTPRAAGMMAAPASTPAAPVTALTAMRQQQQHMEFAPPLIVPPFGGSTVPPQHQQQQPFAVPPPPAMSQLASFGGPTMDDPFATDSGPDLFAPTPRDPSTTAAAMAAAFATGAVAAAPVAVPFSATTADGAPPPPLRPLAGPIATTTFTADAPATTSAPYDPFGASPARGGFGDDAPLDISEEEKSFSLGGALSSQRNAQTPMAHSRVSAGLGATHPPGAVQQALQYDPTVPPMHPHAHLPHATSGQAPPHPPQGAPFSAVAPAASAPPHMQPDAFAAHGGVGMQQRSPYMSVTATPYHPPQPQPMPDVMMAHPQQHYPNVAHPNVPPHQQLQQQQMQQQMHVPTPTMRSDSRGHHQLMPAASHPHHGGAMSASHSIAREDSHYSHTEAQLRQQHDFGASVTGGGGGGVAAPHSQSLLLPPSVHSAVRSDHTGASSLVTPPHGAAAAAGVPAVDAAVPAAATAQQPTTAAIEAALMAAAVPPPPAGGPPLLRFSRVPWAMTAAGTVVHVRTAADGGKDLSARPRLYTEKLSHFLSSAAATPVGRAYAEAARALPTALEPTTAPQVVNAGLQALAPTGPLRPLLSHLLAAGNNVDWAKDVQQAYVPMLDACGALAVAGSSSTGVTRSLAVEVRGNNIPVIAAAAMSAGQRGLLLAPPDPALKAHGEAVVQALLVAGDRVAALRAAMDARLYTIALMVAVMCDKEVYTATISELLALHADATSPLAQTIALFNEMPIAGPSRPSDDEAGGANAKNIEGGSRDGRMSTTASMGGRSYDGLGASAGAGRAQPPEEQAEAQRLLREWATHVKMLLCNFSPAAADALVQWGDALAAVGRQDEAHACYTLAQLSPIAAQFPQVAEGLRTKFTLLGGVYRRHLSRAAYVTLRSIYLSDVMEHVRQRVQEKFVRAQLVPFKVATALLLIELGELDHARTYLELVAKMLPFGAAAPGSSEMHNNANAAKALQQVKTDVAAGLDVVPKSVAHAADLWRRRLAAMARGKGAGSGGSAAAQAGGGGWWPFSRGKSQSAAGLASQIAASAPATESKKDKQATSPAAAPAQPAADPLSRTYGGPAKTKGVAEAAKETADTPTGDGGKLGPKKKSGWGFLGRVLPARQPAVEDGVKVGFMDSEPAPEYDPVTGQYKFARTEEELEQEKKIAAGPPPPSAFTTPQAPRTAPVGAGPQPPHAPHGGMPGVPPLAPPGGMATQPPQPQYAPTPGFTPHHPGEASPSPMMPQPQFFTPGGAPPPQFFVPGGAASPVVATPTHSYPSYTQPAHHPTASVAKYADVFNS